jgi:putative transposase
VERIKNAPHQVAADVPHHVTQRGNTRRFILASDTDRSVYLTLLRENIEICRVFLPGYCLMSNHIHLAAVPKDKKVRQKITTKGDGMALCILIS